MVDRRSRSHYPETNCYRWGLRSDCWKFKKKLKLGNMSSAEWDFEKVSFGTSSSYDVQNCRLWAMRSRSRMSSESNAMITASRPDTGMYSPRCKDSRSTCKHFQHRQKIITEHYLPRIRGNDSLTDEDKLLKKSQLNRFLNRQGECNELILSSNIVREFITTFYSGSDR